MININEFGKKQIVFVFLNQGEKIAFRNDNLVVYDSDRKIRHQSTCYRLFALYVIGHFTLTSGILQKAKKFGFVIVLMTGSLRIYQVIGSQLEGNVLLHRLQYNYDDIEIGKHILFNKLLNQKIILNKQRCKTETLKQDIKKLGECMYAVKNYSGDLSGLLGFEGLGAKVYFRNHFNNIEWQGRKPRIKCDYVNSTLDIGYTLLFSFIESLLRIYGFDLYQGVLHKQFYMRKSLVCDLVEPFRPIIDWQIKKSINLNQCKPQDFIEEQGRYYLRWENNSRYIGFLIQPLLENKREIFLYVQSYYRKFMKNAPVDEFPIFRIT